MSPMLLSIVIFIAVSVMVGAAIFAFRDFGGSKAEERLDVLAGPENPRTRGRRPSQGRSHQGWSGRDFRRRESDGGPHGEHKEPVCAGRFADYRQYLSGDLGGMRCSGPGGGGHRPFAGTALSGG